MPFVSAMLCAEPSSSLTARAVLALTDLTEKVLGKERERVTVAVQYVSEAHWARGAVPARGFYVEVKITSSTNSRDEKARYVREVNRALQSLLGGSSGYVVVDEVAPDAWGYAGETQELRYARQRLLV
ncbi:MAG: 4-oxalocrotonate tautomerase [Betaproteobacteria bacterium]|jgi:4-oxalocrotonate tautomerase|nr:4-oxalocrotonate tautomerase [Betaproteobacteria bacterium]